MPSLAQQVYYFSKFTVKPANKQYATVKNDYELHFDNRQAISVLAAPVHELVHL